MKIAYLHGDNNSVKRQVTYLLLNPSSKTIAALKSIKTEKVSQ